MLFCRDEANQTIYVTPGRDLVTDEAKALRSELQNCVLHGTERLVLDLARVRRIDNDGLEAIVAVYKRICEGLGELIIENASRDLKELCRLTMNDGHITISHTGWPRLNGHSGNNFSKRFTRCRLSWRR